MKKIEGVLRQSPLDIGNQAEMGSIQMTLEIENSDQQNKSS
jgi:hypothetical protein